MTWKSSLVLVILCICRSVASSQQDHNSGAPPIPPLPVLTCQSIQLLLQGRPLQANTLVKLMSERHKWGKPPSQNVMTIRHDLVKKLKTDSRGETKLPKLKPGTYALELPSMKKVVAGGFDIPKRSPLGTCVQTFSLEDKGDHFWLASAKEANNKTNATPQ